MGWSLVDDCEVHNCQRVLSLKLELYLVNQCCDLVC